MNVNVVHADIQTMNRFGMKQLLLRGGGIGSWDSVESKSELQSVLSALTNILIVDYAQSSEFSLSFLKKLKLKHPELKVLIHSDLLTPNTVLSILEIGVYGFLTKACDEDEIINAIFSIAKGEKFYCNKIIDIILETDYDENNQSCAPTSLTSRETEIARLIALGKTNKEVGNELFISHHTVHTHRKNIMRKLSISSSTELVTYAMNTGLI